jgi:hypothetical protein
MSEKNTYAILNLFWLVHGKPIAFSWVYNNFLIGWNDVIPRLYKEMEKNRKKESEITLNT